ncbi:MULTISPECIES: amino acid adenylation domain-containing protein [Pseudonocardia]|uniref:Tyrocidine synthase 1 n=2 Tax=Pseudonocardia TaxID=1847 RepID=A0A1Y2N9U0_PSEAH|nr:MULTISPECIES: amino acid adenylation domain-containing protein [Pseudonocardia]OSY43658.1 Tyrocidine synthase 1 [Pseudonocardia autotrophica]TDN73352.1 amino acid adenylation domain-containing protein [Pseudonocardia autotrophica]BBG04090.1 hypothetical protein Pdca_52990 [Pseudonocardia autotrophica]GEC26227.1 hypothetical protein PSA01_32560 [Pseudonocardia saturnea]
MTDNLQHYVTRAAHKYPERVALHDVSGRTTYADLESWTNRAARLLRETGIAEGDRVCVVGAKSSATIASLVSVLKAGGIYVPIDSASPAARVARILDAAEPGAVLVDASATSLVDALIAEDRLGTGVRIGAVDAHTTGERFGTAFSLTATAGFDDRELAGTRGGDALAHLLFTSGSTGAPKGVGITHRNVLAFVEWATSYFGTSPDDRISGHPPLHFDLSTFDIYATFAAGAELHPVPASLGLDPRGLARFIRDRALTQWFSVPSVLTLLAKFDVVGEDDFPALKRLLWCGEVLPTPVLRHWMCRLPHARFTNLYGPTEATIASSVHTVVEVPETETEPIPIGVACDGEELLVLDEQLRPLPPGEIGDLYIGGVGLSPGYWRDPDRTAEVFVPDPRDPRERIYRTGDLARVGPGGLVDFLGRADSQIKSRGYRIELGEIETAVNAVPGVKECAVVGIPTDGFEGTAIWCSLALVDGAELTGAELRTAVRELLPGYMIPARWEFVTALPKNVNGKIDRRSVRERLIDTTREAG